MRRKEGALFACVPLLVISERPTVLCSNFRTCNWESTQKEGLIWESPDFSILFGRNAIRTTQVSNVSPEDVTANPNVWETEKVSVVISIKLPEERSKYTPYFAKHWNPASNTKESDMREFDLGGGGLCGGVEWWSAQDFWRSKRTHDMYGDRCEFIPREAGRKVRNEGIDSRD